MLFNLVLALAMFSSAVLGLAQVLWFCAGRRDRLLVPAGCLMTTLSPIMLWLVFVAIDQVFAPVTPSTEEIVGEYEIDRDFHPGPQADWQHATYSFEITRKHVTLRDRRTPTVWQYDINWFTSPEYRWKFRHDGPRHHLLADGPAIIREWNGYYYVFESPLYGEVVFRKQKSFAGWWWVGAVLLGGVWLAWRGKRRPGERAAQNQDRSGPNGDEAIQDDEFPTASS